MKFTFRIVSDAVATGKMPGPKFLEPGYRQAAAEFEQQTGLTGIAGRWSFPGGMTAKAMESLVRKHDNAILSGNITLQDCNRIFRDIWDQLTRCNPDLNRLQIDENDLQTLRHAIMGVASGFNYDDIEEFIHIGGGDVRKEDPAYRTFFDHIQRMAGTGIYWIPSLKTLREIERQINNQRKPKQNSRDYR